MFSNISKASKEILASQIISDKPSHAYLFYGAEDEILTKLAFEFTLSLYCKEDEFYCGVCNTCEKIKTENNPDLNHIYKDGNTLKIKQLRELSFDVNMAPTENKYKVYIVHEAHTMSVEAANAFLKTLEEPVGDTVIILLASSKELILPTIRSRCTDIKVYGDESVQLLTPEEENYLLESMRYVFRGERENLVNIASKITGNKENIENYNNFMIKLLCDVLIYKRTEKFSLPENKGAGEAYMEAVKEINSLVDFNRLGKIIDKAVYTNMIIKYNVNASLAYLSLFLNIVGG